MIKLNQTPYGHWKFRPASFDPSTGVGFVYLIIDLDTHEKYIGKKLLRGRGKQNWGDQSDWKSYTSSSKNLNARMSERGKDSFDFVILEQYNTIGGLSFAEIWSQVVCEVPSNNLEFMNRFIDKVSWKVTEPVTDTHKRRLQTWTRKYGFPKENARDQAL